MNNFCLYSPATHPGIYAIVEHVTGKLYIGKTMNLRRRYHEWRGTVATGLGYKNYKLKDAIDAGGEWSFRVLHEAPGVTNDELTNLEVHAIARSRAAKPELVLNVMVPTGLTRRMSRSIKGTQTTPKSTVLASDGTRLPYFEAAARLGCKTKSLQKRLGKLRTQGITEVKLEDLQAATDKARAQWTGIT